VCRSCADGDPGNSWISDARVVVDTACVEVDQVSSMHCVDLVMCVAWADQLSRCVLVSILSGSVVGACVGAC
jgi:hypothetical protein